MSGFWENNKDSIKSGVATVGKKGYQGTKFVASTGYKAGKTHYNNSKEKRNGKNMDTNNTEIRGEAISIDRLSDPKNFPAPPLRTGQKQYAGNGKIVSADDSPILNTPSPVPIQSGNQEMQQQQQPIQQQLPQLQQSQTLPHVQQVQQIQSIPQVPSAQQGYLVQQMQPVEQQPQLQQARSVPQVPQVQQMQQIPQVQEIQQVPQSQSQTPYQQVESAVQPPMIPSRNGQPGNVLPNQQTMNQPPPMPARTCENSNQVIKPENTSDRSASNVSEKSSSVGPQFEVKPFNREEYETVKKEKKFQLKEEDITRFTPPPSHRDRDEELAVHKGTLRERIAESKSRSGTSSLNGTPPPFLPSKTHGGSQTSLHSNGQEKAVEVTNNEESMANYTIELNDGEEKAAVVGAYNEPTTSFAPPPRPKTFSENSSPKPPSSFDNKSRSSSIPIRPPIATKASSVPNAPPVLPRRTTNPSLSSGESKASHDTGKIPENHHAAVVGQYTPQAVNFQPPPQPFRRQPDSDRPDHSNRTSVPQVIPSRKVPNVPPKPVKLDESNFSDKSESVIDTSLNTGGSPVLSEKPSNNTDTKVSQFLPPPKPFRHAELMAENDNNKVHSDQRENKPGDEQSVSPAPLSRMSSANFVKTHPTPKRETSLLSNSSHGDNKEDNSSSMESSSNIQSTSLPKVKSNDFVKDIENSLLSLNLQKRGKKPPPVVKPKPKMLDNIKIDENESVKKPTGKKPPPVVKPKPKNLGKVLDRQGTAEGNVVVNSNGSALGKKDEIIASSSATSSHQQLQQQQPVTANRPPVVSPYSRAQPSPPPPVTSRRKMMPLPADVVSSNSQDSATVDEEVNPFAVYKKDVVPTSNDRIHK